MSERKWISGPWKATRSDPTQGYHVWWLTAGSGNAEREIGSIAGGYPQDEHEATANLISAAPELFEALEPFARAFGTDGKVDLSTLEFDHFHAARIAINKALGKGDVK